MKNLFRAHAAACLLLIALPAVARAEVWERSFEARENPKVRVEAGDARVELHGWAEARIEARVESRGWSLGSGHVEVRIEERDGRVDVIVRERPNFFIQIQSRSILVQVRLPRTGDAEVFNADGRVTADDLNGRIRLRTADGSIRLLNVKGDVELRTADGSIKAEGLSGSLAASSSDGPIHVRGRFERLDVQASDGRVIAEVEPGSRLAGPWSLRTSDGSLEIHLPAGLQADLDISSGDGSVSVNLPVEVTGRFRRSEYAGRLNGGGPLLRLRTADGAIRVEGSDARAGR